eukprot:TRINITY_DN13813_c0_g1_i2.p1 TRINITY_DN13813_c0_g1~~TRINITY_DN13813_c0_g1_i2.p1  ORF type:complete len:292 (-),score=51.23 TRINITY_DN13813_c0_g1_i2:214-1089(-)
MDARRRNSPFPPCNGTLLNFVYALACSVQSWFNPIISEKNMSLQAAEGNTVMAVEGGVFEEGFKPEITKTSVLSPLDSVATTTDLTDAGSEESSRIHPQDSVEDYVREAAKLEEEPEPEKEQKKKSVLRSFKKGASKRYKAFARKSKEISSSLNRTLSGRLSFSRRSVASEDTASQDDNPESVRSTDSDYEKQVSATKIQQAFRSYSTKKRENEVQVEQENQRNEAAVKIQAATRGLLVRKQSFKLKEEVEVAKEEVVPSKTTQKKKGGLKRRLFAVVSVAAVVALGVVKK